MEPITLALIAFGTAAGFWGGKEFSAANHRKEIAQLQEKISRLCVELEKREKKVKLLKDKIRTMEEEVEFTRNARSIFTKLVFWLKGEHPDIIKKFRQVNSHKMSIIELEEEYNQDAQLMNEKVLKMKDISPELASELEAKITNHSSLTQFEPSDYKELCRMYKTASPQEKWQIYYTCKEKGFSNPY